MTPEALFAALPERERQLVHHVARYWLTTANVLHRWFWSDLGPDAIRKALARSADRGWLVRYPLHGQEPYFVLGPAAIAALRLRRQTKALGHQALLEHYAVLLACARRRSDVFTEDEFRSCFPDFTEPGLSAKNHFRDDTSNPPRLGWFVVDHDKLSSRLVNKVGRRAAKILGTDLPEFRKLVLDGRFAVHVITATDGKRANLEAAFARKPIPALPVSVEAHPEELADFFLVKRR
jgi:hypothetical protein